MSGVQSIWCTDLRGMPDNTSGEWQLLFECKGLISYAFLLNIFSVYENIYLTIDSIWETDTLI